MKSTVLSNSVPLWSKLEFSAGAVLNSRFVTLQQATSALIAA